MAIAGWFAFVACAVALAASIPMAKTTNADYRIDGSGRAHAMLADAGLTDPPVESILIDTPTGSLDRVEASSAATELAARMKRAPGVASVDPVMWSQDGSAALVNVVLDQSTSDPAPLLAETAAVQRAYPALRIVQSGNVSINQALLTDVWVSSGRGGLVGDRRG